MADKGKSFLFSKKHGCVSDENGEGCIFDDGSGYYHGNDGSDITLYSDGSGFYYGADGSTGSLFSDGDGYFTGADGSNGTKYSDGSGFYYSSDGSYDSIDSDSTPNLSDEDSELRDLLVDTIVTAGIKLMDEHRSIKKREKEEELQQALEENKRHNEEVRKRRAKLRRWKKKHKKAIQITIFAIIGVILLGICIFELRKMTLVGYSPDELIGTKYSSVVQKLEKAGFSNIMTKDIADLRIEDASDDGIVTDVSIVCNLAFSEKSSFPSNFPIVITYHSLMTIPVPITSKEAKGTDYKTVKQQFRDAGFVNVNTVAKQDLITGWMTKDGEVESVTIDGDKKYDIEDEFRPDVRITIMYHTWK